MCITCFSDDSIEELDPPHNGRTSSTPKVYELVRVVTMVTTISYRYKMKLLLTQLKELDLMM